MQIIKKNFFKLIFFIITPLIIGFLSSLFSGNISSYNELNRPFLSPPSAIFPIVWSILYIFMGFSAFLINLSDSPDKKNALLLYWIQLFMNFMWSILFFKFDLRFISFLWLIALILVVIEMMHRFKNISPLAARLNIPYLLWLFFAAYLNFGFFILNM